MAGLEQYEKFVYEIHSLLKQSELFPKYQKAIAEGRGEFKLSQVFTKKNYSNEWIEVLEDCINALDTIVRNPRKFIVIEEDIVDISLARSISVDSVKHLAQHTNLISSVTKDGLVIPSKILNTSKEESFEIYENRFIYTLLLKARDFLNIRFDAIKGALIESGEMGVAVDTEYLLDGQKVSYHLDSAANIPFDAIVKGKAGGLSDVERLTRIKSIFTDFLSSAFAKEMSTCALVRPPIQRTNVILKDPNFKKALVLWQYIETSEKMEFKVENETETMDMPQALNERYQSLIFLNTVLMQSVAATRDGAETYQTEEEKQPIVADEYTSKNIDDFVPDDFPFLKMELSEIKRIYYKLPGAATLRVTEIAKMNAAIDRVIRQYKINKTKEESAMRKKLVEQQLKEEEIAKKLALREARAAEKQKRLEEVMRKAEAAKLKRKQAERERAAIAEAKRLQLLKEAEEARLRQEQEEKERQEAQRKQEEEARKEQALKDAEAIIAREEEIKRRAIENELKAEEIRLIEVETERIKKETARIQQEIENSVNAYAQQAINALRIEKEKQLAFERELAMRYLTERITEPLTLEQQLTLERLKEEEAVRRYQIEKMQKRGAQLREETLNQRLDRLEIEARTFLSLDDVIEIRRNLQAGLPAKRKYSHADRARQKRAIKKQQKKDGK